MVIHPSVQVIRRAYEALGAGDRDHLERIAAPRFTFEVSGTSAISGKAHGVKEAMGEFQRSMALTGGTMSMEPLQVLADGDVGIVLLELTASRPDGRTVRQPVIHEWRFRDGQVTGIREWIWDQAADVEFWA